MCTAQCLIRLQILWARLQILRARLQILRVRLQILRARLQILGVGYFLLNCFFNYWLMYEGNSRFQCIVLYVTVELSGGVVDLIQLNMIKEDAHLTTPAKCS